MSIDNLSLVLDITILCGLALTIYFALRLSQSLSNFRKQRNDFEKIMRHLNDNIERAHLSLVELKGFSGSFDQDVQDSLREAKDLLDELKVMNHSGNNLADRLESLASRSQYINEAKTAQGSVYDFRSELERGQRVEDNQEDYDPLSYKAISAIKGQMKSEQYDGDNGVFSIQDRDLQGEVGQSSVGVTGSKAGGRSQAEEDLLAALRMKRG